MARSVFRSADRLSLLGTCHSSWLHARLRLFGVDDDIICLKRWRFGWTRVNCGGLRTNVQSRAHMKSQKLARHLLLLDKRTGLIGRYALPSFSYVL